MATRALVSYLSERLDVAVAGTEVLSDGLNLNLAVSTAERENAYVLRRPNKLRHTALFNDVHQEFRLLQRLEDTPVPTPEPVLFCDDESVFGDRFLVTTFLEGAAIPLGSDLPERYRTPTGRRRVADRVVDTLAGIHSLDADLFAAACDRQTPIDQVDHAFDRLDAATALTGRERPRLRSLGGWLRRNAPADPEPALVHGDYRPGNLLFAGAESPEITGVLDWETAMLGDPLTEVGYLLLRWRDDGDPTPSLDDIAARCPDGDAIERLEAANDRGLAPFTADPGSPTRRELVARYEDATGGSFGSERFYRAHAAFMLATVWVDLQRHRLDAGEASDREPHIEYVSAIGQRIARGEFPL